MGILIRKKDEKSKLGSSVPDLYINMDLLTKIEELSLLIQRTNYLDEQLIEIEQDKEKSSSNLDNLINEQTKLNSEIKKVLDKKVEFYKNAKDSLNINGILEINKEYYILLKSQQAIDDKIGKIVMELKKHTKSLDRYIEEKNTINIQIADLRKLIDTEYQNIDCVSIKNSKIITSSTLEKIKDKKNKELIKHIIKKNYELEKIIVQMFNKFYKKITTNPKFSKQYEVLNKIKLLMNINDKIYYFMFHLISSNNLEAETSELLHQTIKLLDTIENYSLHILNDESKKVILNLLNIKSILEINKVNVFNNYQPAFFFKAKLENYKTSNNILMDILNNSSLYLKALSESEEKSHIK